MENLSSKMKKKSAKMSIALRAVALVLLLGVGFGQLAAQPSAKGKNGKNGVERGIIDTSYSKPSESFFMNKFINKDGNKLTLESFVKGLTKGGKAADICVVLDASSSLYDSRYTKKMKGWLPVYDEPRFSYNMINNATAPYYFKWFDGTEEKYCQVKGEYVKYSGNNHYWLYFENAGNRYYLIGNEIRQAQSWEGHDYTGPTDIHGNKIPASSIGNGGGYFWTGSLYKYYSSDQNMPEEYILQEAISSFISYVRRNSLDNIDTVTGQPVNHRVSLVQFSKDCFRGDTYSTSALGDYLDPRYEHHIDDLTEGYNLILTSDYNASSHMASNWSELISNLYAPSDLLNFNNLRMRTHSIRAGGVTATNYGVKKAERVLDSVNNPFNHTLVNKDRSKVVVVFTDGELQVSNPHGSSSAVFVSGAADQTVRICHDMKEKGYKVFCVGLFHDSNPNNDAHKLVKYMSSSFPDATSFSNPGNHASDTCYFTVSNAADLQLVFEKIAEEVVAGEKWGSQTVVRDVISQYFQLPDNVQESDIVVKTAKCTKFYNDSVYVFGSIEEFPAHVQISDTTVLDIHNNEVQCDIVTVKNFDFAENWCGKKNDAPRGKKLIIEIPIKEKPGIEPGMHYTNEPGSTIIPNGNEDPTKDFPVPEYYVKGITWVEAIHENPGANAIEKIDDVYHIKTKEGLAWFISIVCGYNGQTAEPGANAVLEADVDMTQGYFQGKEEQLGLIRLIWVPIGGFGFVRTFDEEEGWKWNYPESHGYSGTFDGQGHTIRGLRNPDPVSVPQVGMFGYVNHGTIMNVFVVNCEFTAAVGNDIDDLPSTGIMGHFGIIADTLCGGGQIFNCEAAGLIRTFDTIGPMFDDSDYEYLYAPEQNPSQCFIGGLVGLVGRDKSGTISPATVHSCMSMANVMGYGMSGLAYEVESGSKLKNCYDYTAHLKLEKDYELNFGGLVGLNKGTVENCYLRDRNDILIEQTIQVKEGEQIHEVLRNYTLTGISNAIGTATGSNNKNKGFLFGKNTGSFDYIYVHDNDTWKATANFIGDGSAEGHIVSTFTPTVTPYLYKHHDTQVANLLGTNSSIEDAPNDRLLQTLNNWVGSVNGTGCTPWMRTTANGINNDYPVLNIDEFQYVAADNVAVIYGDDVNDVLDSRKLMTDEKDDDVIYLYKNAHLNQPNNGTTLYIDENVAVTQAEGLVNTAYVGITLDNSAGAGGVNSDHGFADDEIDWHMFATSLSNAPLGINYNGDTQSWPFVYGHPEGMPNYSFYDESEQDGYFPSKTFGTDGTDGIDYYSDWDFYCWDEKYQHYINFKRNSNSHWYEGAPQQIAYTNESELVPGKGYMLAIANETFLQSHGTLNNGTVTRNVTYHENPFCPGYNLIGNPYQSYLDFDSLASANDINTYAILDEDSLGYLTYTATSTSNPMRYINMHQGFFIKVAGDQTLTFNNKMRKLTATANTHFRGEGKQAYPYLRLFVKEADGCGDYTTIEFNRPELGGGEKFMDLRAGNAQIYVHNGETNYSTLFATSDFSEVSVRFNTLEDGTFTLSWQLSEGDFNEMYLIDNINGQKTDMLTHNNYKFEGHAADYASRFNVVFHLDGGNNSESDVEPVESFAFQMGGNLIVNGMGTCQVFDLTGRLVSTNQLTDTQNTMALPQTAGIYMIRLVNGSSVKVQKLVVE